MGRVGNVGCVLAKLRWRRHHSQKKLHNIQVTTNFKFRMLAGCSEQWVSYDVFWEFTLSVCFPIPNTCQCGVEFEIHLYTKQDESGLLANLLMIGNMYKPHLYQNSCEHNNTVSVTSTIRVRSDSWAAIEFSRLVNISTTTLYALSEATLSWFRSSQSSVTYSYAYAYIITYRYVWWLGSCQDENWITGHILFALSCCSCYIVTETTKMML